VQAQSEGHARGLVQTATQQLMDHKPGKPILYPPWIDGSLVTCRIDVDGKEVPEGVILTVSGRTIRIEN
jgi:hypothetical protein